MQAQIESKPKELFLTYPQDKFIFCKDHFVCIKGTWGCGKSLAGLLAANKECEENPGNLYLVIRKEWVDLRDSTLHDWEQWVGRPINSEKNVIYPNGSVLMFRHGEDINSLKNSNLGGCLMIQAEEMKEEDLWFINGRLRRKQGTRQLRLECNYDGHNWIYRLFDLKKTSDDKEFEGTLIKTNTFDNEANLPADYIPNLKRLPKKLQDKFLYGSDADMTGQIWEMWSEGDHVIDPFQIPHNWLKFTSSDMPVASGTLATLFFAVDEHDNYYVYDEYQAEGKLISDHCEALLNKVSGHTIDRWYSDTSAFNKTREKYGKLYSVADEVLEYGIPLIPAQKDECAGINRVGEYLSDKKLKVFKNCVRLRERIPEYRWSNLKPTTRGEQKQTPYRINTHMVEALRYGVFSHLQGYKPAPPISHGEHSLQRYINDDANKEEVFR